MLAPPTPFLCRAPPASFWACVANTFLGFCCPYQHLLGFCWAHHHLLGFCWPHQHLVGLWPTNCFRFYVALQTHFKALRAPQRVFKDVGPPTTLGFMLPDVLGLCSFWAGAAGPQMFSEPLWPSVFPLQNTGNSSPPSLSGTLAAAIRS